MTAADLQYELDACRAARAAIDARIVEILSEMAPLDEALAHHLWELVCGLDWPPRVAGRAGRPRDRLDEVVFALAWRAHTGKSTRATTAELVALTEREVIAAPVRHNTIIRYEHSAELAERLRDFLGCVVDGDPPEAETRRLLRERHPDTKSEIRTLCKILLLIARELVANVASDCRKDLHRASGA